MPYACGTSSQNKKSYQLYKPKQNTKQNTVCLTPQISYVTSKKILS